MSATSSRAAQSVVGRRSRRRRSSSIVDQVHLVDADDDVRDAQQRGDVGVAPGLLDDALARVDEDDRQVGGRGAGDHVARVLHVAGRVGDDELRRAGGEVAVGDVDRDPLLALGAQPVGEQRQVRGSRRRGARSVCSTCSSWSSRIAWSRRAAGRSASTCRRRPSPRWRSAGAHCTGVRVIVPVCSGDSAHGSRSSPRACGPPSRPR